MNNNYYAKKVYKSGIYYGCVRDPETVKNDFNNDIKRLEPVHVSRNINRYYFTFAYNDSMIFYELPIDYKL